MKSSTDVFLPMPDPSVKNSEQNCQFMVLKRHPRNSIFWSALNHLIRSELKVFKQSDLQQIGSIFLVHLHFPCAGTFPGAGTFSWCRDTQLHVELRRSGVAGLKKSTSGII